MSPINSPQELEFQLKLFGQELERALIALDPTGQMRQAMTAAQVEQLYPEARALLASGQVDAALEPFTRLVVCAPHDARFQLGLGLCLQRLGRIEDAARHYGMAYIMNPSDAACAFRLAECLESSGDVTEAKDAYLAALQLCDVPGASQELRPYAQAGLDRLNA